MRIALGVELVPQKGRRNRGRKTHKPLVYARSGSLKSSSYARTDVKKGPTLLGNENQSGRRCPRSRRLRRVKTHTGLAPVLGWPGGPRWVLLVWVL